MADADTLLRDGDVDAARSALVDIVRTKPGDQTARMFLFQLLAVSGEYDKALKQLESLVHLSPEAQMLGVTYNQAIGGEKQRADVFAGKADLPLHAGEGGWAEGVAKGISLIARGDVEGGIAARDEAFDNAPDMPGTFDGTAIEWIADADSRFGPTFEAIIGGRYGLMPFDEVEWIRSEGPRDLRDMIWYPVQIGFRNGQSGAAFLPARYPGTDTDGTNDQKLARVTDWQEREWGDAGIGQRLWTLSDGTDKGIFELRNLEFD